MRGEGKSTCTTQNYLPSLSHGQKHIVLFKQLEQFLYARVVSLSDKDTSYKVTSIVVQCWEYNSSSLNVAISAVLTITIILQSL